LEDIRKTGKGRRHIKVKRLKDVFDQLDDNQLWLFIRSILVVEYKYMRDLQLRPTQT
jgi:hypothetical protein